MGFCSDHWPPCVCSDAVYAQIPSKQWWSLVTSQRRARGHAGPMPAGSHGAWLWPQSGSGLKRVSKLKLLPAQTQVWGEWARCWGQQETICSLGMSQGDQRGLQGAGPLRALFLQRDTSSSMPCFSLGTHLYLFPALMQGYFSIRASPQGHIPLHAWLCRGTCPHPPACSPTLPLWAAPIPPCLSFSPLALLPPTAFL